MKWLEPIVVAIGGATLTASAPKPVAISPIGSTTVTPAASSTPIANGIAPMKLGMNVAGPAYYANTRPFMNLIAGSGWGLIKKSGAGAQISASQLDANKNIIALEPGDKITRVISVPTRAYRGVSVDITCRWTGKATVQIWGETAKNVLFTSANSLKFTFVPKGLQQAQFWFSYPDAANPIKGIDCRESDADPNAIFDPTFIADVKRFNTVRFLKWTRSVESNIAVTWAGRTKPGDGLIDGWDSVPIEYMIELANQTNTNPWFTIPWNADADYIRQFATLVKAKLNPGLKAYVETSNEVWNWTYPVTAQALKEGKTAGLATDDGSALVRRYAQRTGEIMDIWSSVFADNMSRIVRVLALQNGATWAGGVMLSYGDTAKKVDAIASAPYFSGTLPAGAYITPDKMTYFFDVHMGVVDTMITSAKTMKDFAKKYNLRYVTYEAGQHYLSPDDLNQLQLIQRDPRMGKLYTRYLQGWKDQVGDLMVLFEDYAPVSKYGAWGIQEYPGQPLSEAPKANAVELFRQSYAVK